MSVLIDEFIDLFYHQDIGCFMAVTAMLYGHQVNDGTAFFLLFIIEQFRSLVVFKKEQFIQEQLVILLIH